ncbi:MAG TPA: acyl carrier protein [Solirubrobacterales bacterium]
MANAETIANFLVDEVGVSAPLDHGDDLLASDQLDSQGIMELVAFLEEGFSIEVRDEDLVPDNFKSVDAITALVARKQDG